jgi:hypothetical protein
MGWDDAKDDYAVLDGEKSVGRIYKETVKPNGLFGNTSPFPAPLPEQRSSRVTGRAKQQFEQRYEEIKAQGVPAPCSGGELAIFDRIG